MASYRYVCGLHVLCGVTLLTKHLQTETPTFGTIMPAMCTVIPHVLHVSIVTILYIWLYRLLCRMFPDIQFPNNIHSKQIVSELPPRDSEHKCAHCCVQQIAVDYDWSDMNEKDVRPRSNSTLNRALKGKLSGA